MSRSDDGRRYSEEEFALILRIASEVGTGPDPAPPRQGLTISQIRAIAAEAGIDPERVSRAALLVPSGKDTTSSRLLGGPARHRLEHSISGVVPRTDLGRVIDVARRALSVQGETREVLGALEWKGSTGTATTVVSIIPREGETILQASVDRTESLLGTYVGVGISVAGVTAALLVKLVYGETDAGIAAAIVSGFAPSLLVARALWKRSTKKWHRRMLHLMGALATEAEEAIARTVQDETAPPLQEPAEGSNPLEVDPAPQD